MPADTSGLKALQAALARTDLGRSIEQAIDQAAEDMAAHMRSLAPVDTGALRDSIRVDKAGPFDARVLADAREAFYVEFGTSKMPPRPFFKPAGNRAAGALPKAIDDALGRRLG